VVRIHFPPAAGLVRTRLPPVEHLRGRPRDEAPGGTWSSCLTAGSGGSTMAAARTRRGTDIEKNKGIPRWPRFHCDVKPNVRSTGSASTTRLRNRSSPPPRDPRKLPPVDAINRGQAHARRRRHYARIAVLAQAQKRTKAAPPGESKFRPPGAASSGAASTRRSRLRTAASCACPRGQGRRPGTEVFALWCDGRGTARDCRDLRCRDHPRRCCPLPRRWRACRDRTGIHLFDQIMPNPPRGR
jgi:hypothetical protein